MHNWWAEYDILMANYRAMFADNVCHNPDMLNASLLIIEAKIEKVAFDTHKKTLSYFNSKANVCQNLGQMGLDPEGRTIGPHPGYLEPRGLQEHHRPGKGTQPVLG